MMSKNDRYQRNFLTQNEQKKLAQSKVLVCGCGGLGSSVITNLISLGVENLILLDCDIVEISNFNRQFIHKEKNLGQLKTLSAKEFVEGFNSRIKVKLINQKLNNQNVEEIVAKIDCVVDCFDNWEAKFLLNKYCVNKKIPLVHGGVEKNYGQVFSVLSPQTACLECFLSGKNSVANKEILAPTVNLIGSIMANEILKILLKKTSEISVILRYDLRKNEFKKILVEKNKNCEVCRQV